MSNIICFSAAPLTGSKYSGKRIWAFLLNLTGNTPGHSHAYIASVDTVLKVAYLREQIIITQEARRRQSIKSDLIQAVMSRKLGLFGYYTQNEGQQENKSVMLGLMDGKRTTGKT